MMNRLIKRINTNFENVESINAITSAASLAYHGLLSIVNTLTMRDMDLSSVPTSHMTKLAYCAEKDITINNATGFDLVGFLKKIPYGEQLNIDEQSLNDDEAQALMKILGRVDIVETSDKTFLNLVNRTAERLTEKLSSSDIPIQEGRYINQDLITASILANHGFIKTMDHLSLKNINDNSIIIQWGMSSLFVCVHGSMALRNIDDDGPTRRYPQIPNSSLVQILKLVSVKDLFISSQIMGSKSSKTLVGTMARRVRTVKLGEQVTLDIKTFTEYDGMGKCSTVMCVQDTAERYKKDLMDWAQKINWDVDLLNNYIIVHRSEG